MLGRDCHARLTDKKISLKKASQPPSRAAGFSFGGVLQRSSTASRKRTDVSRTLGRRRGAGDAGAKSKQSFQGLGFQERGWQAREGERAPPAPGLWEGSW